LLREKQTYPPALAVRHLSLISDLCKGEPPQRALVYLSLYCISQLASLCGVIFYKLNYNIIKRPASVFPPRLFISAQILKNFLLFFPPLKGLKIKLKSLTTGDELFPPDQLGSAAIESFEMYERALAKVGHTSDWISGLDVMEIGPGSHLGVSLLFLTCGAKRVVSIDRYGEVKCREKESFIYRKISQCLSAEKKADFERLSAAANTHDRSLQCLQILTSTGIDDIKKLEALFPAGSFDLIVSHNTLEHVRDMRAAFKNMQYLLRRGGLCVHLIYAGSHYAFTRYTKNRLSQFVLSHRIYNLMFSNRGGSNRLLFSQYLTLAESEGFVVRDCEIDEYASVFELARTREFLDAHFEQSSEEDLLKLGFVLLLEKK